MDEQTFIKHLATLPWSESSRVIRRDMVKPGALNSDVCAWVTDIDSTTLENSKTHRDALRSLRVFPLVVSGFPSLISLDDPKTVAGTYDGMAMSRAASCDVEIICPPGKDYLPFQKAGIVYARQRSGTLFGDEMGLGKGFAKNHVLPTLDGLGLKMDDIKVGDMVIGRNGCNTPVTAVFRRGIQQMYRITFWDGSTVECDGDHLWNVYDSNAKRRLARGLSKYTTLDTRTLFERSNRGVKFRLPLCEPVQFPDKELPIKAYVMGVILSEGYVGEKAKSAVISISDLDLDILSRVRNESGAKEGWQKKGCRAASIPGVLPILSEYGVRKLSHHKFIPHDYLISSVQQRIDILRGLMDGDGSITKNRTTFCTSSLRLAEGVKALVSSLGGIAKIRTYHRDKGTDYQVNIKTTFCPFFCARKSAKWTRPDYAHQPKRSILNIEKLEELQETICIKVAAEDSLFLCGDDYVVTHNTIQAIGVCNDLNINDVVVVCPAYLKLNWEREIRQWRVGEVEVFVLYGKSPVPPLGAPKAGTSRFIIINYEILGRFTGAFSSHTFGALILDEAHCIKNLDTQRTKATFAISAKRKLALTGTPALNRPFELYPLVKLLMPRPMSKETFGRKFCGSGGRGSIDFRGSSNPVALQQLLRQNFMIRRLKKNVLKELPPKRRQVIELPPPGEIKMVLDLENETWGPHEETLIAIKHQMDEAEMAEDDEAFMRLAGQFGTKMAIAFSEMAKIRVELSMAKIQFIAPHCREFLLGSDEKLIIFFYHKEAAGALCSALSEFGSRLITGDVKMSDRDAAVQAFQTDPKCRVIIGTIGAMGTGVTLTASSTVIMAELDWRPGILAQAEDRAHRIGQLESVLCQYFVFSDSVDSKMVFDIISKMSVLFRVLDSESTTNDSSSDPLATPAKRTKKRRRAIKVEKEKHDLVLGALRVVAANNRDMARETNGVGFSKFDSYAGMKLSSLGSLQRGELSFAANLVWKYRKQIDPLVIRDIWPNGIEND